MKPRIYYRSGLWLIQGKGFICYGKSVIEAWFIYREVYINNLFNGKNFKIYSIGL